MPISRSFTEADLWRPDGCPIRIREVMLLTGRSRAAILSAMERGDLAGFQYLKVKGSPWYFERRTVADWWEQIRHDHAC